MVKTGVSLFIALSLVVMLLPLLPLCILFVRKVYLSAILNVLRLLCLYFFLRQLLITFLLPDNPFIRSGSQLLEFAIILYLCKLMLANKQSREILNLFLVAFLSVVITIYSIKGMMAFPKAITLIQAAAGVVIAIIVLVQLINNQQILLLSEPVFWIAGGCFCYFGMLGLMEALTPLEGSLPGEEMLISFITNITRFAFFTIAAAVAPAKVSSQAHRLQ